MKDVVRDFIELREEIKEKEKTLKALEVIIMEDHQDDDRITIVAGRTSTIITDKAYEKLEALGFSVTVTEERPKKLIEFDVDTRDMILSNPDNYEVKKTKDWIKVKKGKSK